MPEETPRHTSRLLNMAVPMRDAGPRQAVPIDVGILARAEVIDQTALFRYRLERLRAELRKRDYAGAVLSDPMNLRYATGTRNMAVWTAHAPGRYAFVATDGPVILFEFTSKVLVARMKPEEVLERYPEFLSVAQEIQRAHPSPERPVPVPVLVVVAEKLRKSLARVNLEPVGVRE